MTENGTSIRHMLTASIPVGGQAIMCGGCLKAAGLTEADNIDGVTMGTWSVIEGRPVGPELNIFAC